MIRKQAVLLAYFPEPPVGLLEGARWFVTWHYQWLFLVKLGEKVVRFQRGCPADTTWHLGLIVPDT